MIDLNAVESRIKYHEDMDASYMDAVDTADMRALVEAVKQLKESKEIIRTWHNIGMRTAEAEECWKLYDENAPEMKRLNAALAAFDLGGSP